MQYTVQDQLYTLSAPLDSTNIQEPFTIKVINKEAELFICFYYSINREKQISAHLFISFFVRILIGSIKKMSDTETS